MICSTSLTCSESLSLTSSSRSRSAASRTSFSFPEAYIDDDRKSLDVSAGSETGWRWNDEPSSRYRPRRARLGQCDEGPRDRYA